MRTLFSRLSAAVCLLLILILGLAAPALAAAPSGEALDKILQRFEAYAEKNRQAFGVPGMAMAVVAGDKVIYAKGLGKTALTGGTPVNPETIFQIGSTSKSFTAGLVGMMVDQGKMSWDDPLIKHHPSFLMQDSWVTREFLVKDLMAQHTGLAPHAGELLAFLGYSPAHMMASLQYFEPVSSFRAAFAYQNVPFLVAAAMVGRYTGQDYAANLQKLIFTPLGMKKTSVPVKGLPQGPNVTRLHMRPGGKLEQMPPDWPMQDWIYGFAPAGGICSTVLDMAQWLRLHINRGEVDGKRLIKAETMDFMHTPVTPVAADLAKGGLAQYCQAWVYSRFSAPYTMIWHNGDTTVNHAAMAFMPTQKVGIVMLSNLGGVDLLDRLAHYFCDLYTGQEPGDYAAEELKSLLAAEKEFGLPPRPKGALPPQPLKNYSGDYFNPVYLKVKVEARGQDLILVLGPRATELKLLPWNRDDFAAMDLTAPGSPLGMVSFGCDEEAKVNRFVLDRVASEAGGLFKRVK